MIIINGNRARSRDRAQHKNFFTGKTPYIRLVSCSLMLLSCKSFCDIDVMVMSVKEFITTVICDNCDIQFSRLNFLKNRIWKCGNLNISDTSTTFKAYRWRTVAQPMNYLSSVYTDHFLGFRKARTDFSMPFSWQMFVIFVIDHIICDSYRVFVIMMWWLQIYL